MQKKIDQASTKVSFIHQFLGNRRNESAKQQPGYLGRVKTN